MRAKSKFRASISQKELRHEMPGIQLELSSKDFLSATPILRFFSLDEMDSYFYDVYHRNWSSVESVNEDRNVSEGDLSWIPDEINTDDGLDNYSAYSASNFESGDEDSFLEDPFDATDDRKGRIKHASRRRDHWAKDQLHPAKVCKILMKKAYKEISDSPDHCTMQDKFDSFFKAHVHSVSVTFLPVIAIKGSHRTPTSELPDLPSRTTRYVNSGFRSNTAKGSFGKKYLRHSKSSLIPGKYNYKKFSPILIEHGYGFGLLYRHI